ncbi:tetratricopeptide repeat protein [Candidatus Peregrinibacteria bacterium]|nr:tetratricopeptide repeat protein [Candidatus Peregrinibacteria bacterium]
MRKFLAFLLAVILALVVVTGGLFYKQEGSFNEFSFSSAINIWKDIVKIDSKVNDKDKVAITETNIPEIEENLSYDERIEKGDYYFERGFLSFASNEYVKAANMEPNRVDPYIKLLKTNYELGDYAKAQKNAETILEKIPNDSNTLFDLAMIHIKQSEFESASTILESLSVGQNVDPRITYYRGLLQIVNENHDEGKKLIRQALSTSKDPLLDADIETILAAYTEYEFAKAADEIYLSELLARSFNKLGEYEMAIHKLKGILKTRNDLRDAWILFGFAYLSLEKYYFAQSAFERAYELDSEWPTTQYFLGLTLAEMGSIDDAIIYLNYALSNNFQPEIVVHQKLADLYMEKGDYTKSVESYEKVLALSDDDINSFVRPIWIYLDYLNEPDKALNIAEVANTTFPENAMSYNLLGWSQIGTEDYNEAEINLKKAIELDPNLPAAYYNIARLYDTQNRKSLALEAYQKAYELDTNGSIGNLAAQAYNELLSQ